MRPWSSSKGRNTSASVTVTFTVIDELLFVLLTSRGANARQQECDKTRRNEQQSAVANKGRVEANVSRVASERIQDQNEKSRPGRGRVCFQWLVVFAVSAVYGNLELLD